VSVFGLALSLLASIYFGRIMLFGWILWGYGHKPDQGDAEDARRGRVNGNEQQATLLDDVELNEYAPEDSSAERTEAVTEGETEV